MPLAIALKESLETRGGTLPTPSAFQQMILPSTRIPQVELTPASIALNESFGAPKVALSSCLSAQQMTLPSSLMAQVWS